MSSDKPKSEFGTRIEGLCEERGIPMSEVAKAIGMYPSNFYVMLQNNNLPSGTWIKKIAVALNVTSDFLLGVDEVDRDEMYYFQLRNYLAKHGKDLKQNQKLELISFLVADYY